jgi:hypothetical protein
MATSIYPASEWEPVTYPADLSSSQWTKLTPIHREFITRHANGVDKDRVVCEALQKCFDVLVEGNQEYGGDTTTEFTMTGITADRTSAADKVLKVAVAWKWLPESMLPDTIADAHREWFLNLIRARVHYFLDSPLEKALGRYSPKPDFVVIPIPGAESNSANPQYLRLSKQTWDPPRKAWMKG